MSDPTPPLFDLIPKWQKPAAQAPAPPRTEQARQLKRVSGALADLVLSFLRERGVGGSFRMSDLGKHVQDRHPCAPGSESRILRSLRASGVIGYDLLNRTHSLYRITKLQLAPQARPGAAVESERRDLE
jgi:hypothetical protein